jgi:hypothetical protein
MHHESPLAGERGYSLLHNIHFLERIRTAHPHTHTHTHRAELYVGCSEMSRHRLAVGRYTGPNQTHIIDEPIKLIPSDSVAVFSGAGIK